MLHATELCMLAKGLMQTVLILHMKNLGAFSRQMLIYCMPSFIHILRAKLLPPDSTFGNNLDSGMNQAACFRNDNLRNG